MYVTGIPIKETNLKTIYTAISTKKFESLKLKNETKTFNSPIELKKSDIICYEKDSNQLGYAIITSVLPKTLNSKNLNFKIDKILAKIDFIPY